MASSTGVPSDSVGGTFSNSGSAPSDQRNNSSSVAGTFSNSTSASQTATGDSFGPSAGYDNNVSKPAEPEKKHGILGKVKDAFVPKPGSIGRVENEDLTASGAASVKPDAGRHEQANRDLNRE